ALTAPGGQTLSYAYDGALRTDSTWAGPVTGSLHHTYDNFLRVASETVNGAGAVSFQYDADGLLIAAGNLSMVRDVTNGLVMGTSIGNVTDTLMRDSFGAPLSYGSSYQGGLQLSIQYTRDAVGRIAEKDETVLGTTHTYVYSYDLSGRLVGVTLDGSGASS